MLNSEKIVVSYKNVKSGKMDEVSKFVHFYVRYTEYNRVHDGISEELKKISDAHVDVDSLKCSDERAREILREVDKTETGEKYTPMEIEEFITARNDLNEISEELKEIGIKYSDFTALSTKDKCFIELGAHTAISSILLEESVFENADFSEVIETYYSNGKTRELCGKMQSFVDHVVGVEDRESDLFYSVRVKKINGEMLRNFCAGFRGKANRVKTTKDKITTYGAYVYAKTEKDKKAQMRNLTTFLAVLLDRHNDYMVIKDGKEEKVEEEKTKKTAKNTAKKTEKKTGKKTEEKTGEKTENK